MKIGDEIPVWWSTGKKDSEGRNIAMIMDITPYTGKFPQWFDVVLTLNTLYGKTQMTYNSKDFVTSADK